MCVKCMREIQYRGRTNGVLLVHLSEADKHLVAAPLTPDIYIQFVALMD